MSPFILRKSKWFCAFCFRRHQSDGEEYDDDDDGEEEDEDDPEFEVTTNFDAEPANNDDEDEAADGAPSAANADSVKSKPATPETSTLYGVRLIK